MLIYDKISIGAKIKPWKIYANFHMDLIDTHLNREKMTKFLIDDSLPMTDGNSKFRVENEIFWPNLFFRS